MQRPPPVHPPLTQVELLAGLDCSSCHLNYAHYALRAEDINKSSPTLRKGFMRSTRGYPPAQIDAMGNLLPGAKMVEYEHEWVLESGGTKSGGFCLLDFVLEREPPASHDAWRKASKKDLAAQVSGWPS